MKIAYLASKGTVVGSPLRRDDAFEHDQMMDSLRAAFAKRGDEVLDIAWDDEAADWSAFDAAVIGTTWDYHSGADDFLETLASIEAKTKLFNPVSLVKWNLNKQYLKDLEGMGVPTIPTLWVDRFGEAEAKQAFDTFGGDVIIAKRQVGAGAEGQYKIRKGESYPSLDHPMMVQPFIPSIVDEGELSFVFIGGELSHTLLKVAAKGDYRIQSLYGGREIVITPSEDDFQAAKAALAAAPLEPLYGRVDMVRSADGSLMLIELELIEPFLYPLQGPELGENLYRALMDVL